MKKFAYISSGFLLAIILLAGVFSYAQTIFTTRQGGTGTSSPSGILKGAGNNSPLLTAVPGTDYVANTTGDWSGTFDGQEGSWFTANSFSTTSADLWKTLRNFFSTTSVDYWESTQTARTADDLSNNTTSDLAEGSNLYYTTLRDIKFSTTSADHWRLGTLSPHTAASYSATSTATSTFAGGGRVTGDITASRSIEAQTLHATGTASSSISHGLTTARVNTTATSTMAGLRLVSGGLTVSGLDCSGLSNGGALTTDSAGNVVCSADDSGAGGDGQFSTTSANHWVQSIKDPLTAASYQATSTATSTYAGGQRVTGGVTANYGEFATLRATNTVATSTFSGGFLANFMDMTTGFISRGASFVLGKFTVRGTSELATTTAPMINGTIYVDGVHYAKTGAGIQNALNDAAPLKTCVYLSPGVYEFSTSTVMASDSCLIGAGRDVTFLMGSAAVDAPVLRTDKTGTAKNSWRNITVKDLSIHARRGHVTRFNNVENLLIENVAASSTATNIRESIFVEYGQNVKVRDSYVYSTRGDGIQINAVDYFEVIGNTISSSTDDAIDIDADFLSGWTIPSQYGSVIGNTIEIVPGGHCIRIENANYVTVDSNVVRKCSTGILINNTVDFPAMRGIVISNNVTRDNDVTGIRVDASDGLGIVNTLITGNMTVDEGASAGSNVGGGIVVNASSTSVVGNTVLNGGMEGGGDDGGIVVYKANDVSVKDNDIASSTRGINVWNGDGLQTYINLDIADNRFEDVTTKYSGATGQAGVGLVTTGFNSSGTFLGLGIGTTTPSSLLSVQGSALISGTTTVGGLIATSTIKTSLNCTGFSNGGALTTNAAGELVCSNDDSSAGGTFEYDWKQTLLGGTNYLQPTTTISIYPNNGFLSAASSTVMGTFTITDKLVASTTATSTFAGGVLFGLTGGNVGIGVADPNTTLQVNGTLQVGDTTAITTGLPASLRVRQANDNFALFSRTGAGTWALGIDSTGDFHLTDADGTGQLFSIVDINDGGGGNTGIGSSTPRARLGVHGDALISGTTTVAGLIATGTPRFPALASCNTIDTTAEGFLKCGTDEGGAGSTFGQAWEINAAGYLAPTSTITTLHNNGFVSQASSTVNGTLRVQDALYASSTAAIDGALTITTLTPLINLVATAAQDFQIEAGGGSFKIKDTTNTLTPFTIDATADTNMLYISGNDRVGVNDGSPDYRFEVAGTSGSGYFAITNSTDGDIFEIDTGGNVGIATTTPSTNFAVQGNALISGTTTMANLTATGTAYITAGLSIDAAGFLKIPSGTDPSNLPQTIAIDTTTNQLQTATSSGGGAAVYATVVKPIYQFTIASTTSGWANSGALPLPIKTYGWTGYYIQCSAWGGTSKVINLTDSSGNDATSVTCSSATSTQHELKTNNVFTASEGTSLEFGATTGQVDWLSVSVWGVITPD